jgi:hypothetical protein
MVSNTESREATVDNSPRWICRWKIKLTGMCGQGPPATKEHAQALADYGNARSHGTTYWIEPVFTPDPQPGD